MLKTAVIYLPGSGGNFLYRTLNLGPYTMDPNEQDPRSNTIRTTPEQRLAAFNNWGSVDREDWKDRECEFVPGYKLGPDYYLYEQSDLWFVDCWHSSEFLNEIETLWGPDMFFETLIMIDPTGYEQFLVENQSRKKYNCDLALELPAHKEIGQRYADRVISIPFASFFAWETFEFYINTINQQLELDLPMASVQQNWANWLTHSHARWQVT